MIYAQYTESKPENNIIANIQFMYAIQKFGISDIFHCFWRMFQAYQSCIYLIKNIVKQ